MRKTVNYGLSLYDVNDKMTITAEEDSLNANMEIIDKTLKEKATIKELSDYVDEHKEELKGQDGDSGTDGVGISTINVSTNGELTVTLTNETVLELGNIKGPQGEPGEQGIQGEKGDSGEQGPQGETGNDGESVMITDVVENTEDDGYSTITFSDGNTVNIKNGSKGSQGEPGENGQDGTSVTIDSVTESDEDGGKNIVAFSNGMTIAIKNGTKGTQGDKGDKGDTGDAGKDGTSITITSTIESTEDSGKNVVTFSNGQTLTVKNGSKGSNGIGITSVEQTTTSTEDDGNNVITVTLSDETTSTFSVKNGSKGSKGDAFTYNDFTPEQLDSLKGSNGLSVKSATAQYVNENSTPTLKFTFTMSDDSTLPVNVDLTQFKQEIINEINAQYVNVSEVGQ